MVSAVRESVRMVISLVLGWSCRAFAMPVRSPSATDAILPRYVDLEGCISPQVDAPLSVIAPPAALPSAPERKTRDSRAGYIPREFRVTPDKDMNSWPMNTGGNSIQVANAMQKKKTRADAVRLKA